MPDILLLPELATLFHVTIDELIGYEPVLSTEQIRKLYGDFSNDFTHKAPEEVMTTIRSYIHKYYACDAFLVQMTLLLLNHYMLFPEPQMQAAILDEAMQLCRNVKESSNDIVLIDNAISLETMCHLLLGDARFFFQAALIYTNEKQQSKTLYCYCWNAVYWTYSLFYARKRGLIYDATY